jgi:DNA-binding transcriptional LysR family regulator
MFIRQLEYLVTLAREKHFAKAAELCHVSQPALSSGIRNLEKELGILIVQRERRYVGLTVEGERVLLWAQQTLASLSNMREDASTARSRMAGVLRIGAIPTTMPITAYMTAACRSSYPNIRFAISSLSFEAIVSGLDQFELDLGLTYLDDPVAEGFEALPLFDERYVLIGGRNVKFEDTMSWEQAAGLPMCLLSPKMRNRQVIDAAFRKVGAKPDIILETDSLFSLYAHVSEAGLYSVVPHSLLSFLDKTRIQARPLLPAVTRAIGLIARSKPTLAPVAGAVLEVARGLALQSRFDADLLL